MASVAIIHYTHSENSDGTSPIVIRVIENRKPKKRTIANVLPAQWDDKKKRVIPKSHPNYAIINIQISDEYNRIEGLILSNKFNLQRDFIDYFDKLKAGIDPVTEEKRLSFKEIVPLYISSLKSGFSMIGYQTRLKYFIDNSGIGDIRSSEITKAHMDKFIKHMTDKGNKRSTMRTNLKIVRFASSFASAKGLDTKSSAVHDFPLPIAERSIKRKLDKDELLAFKTSTKVVDKNTREFQDMFMLAVYCRGMRIGDVIQLRQDSIIDGRIVYESGKNKKTFNIKLIPEALEIVNKYLDKREYLFTQFKWVHDKNLSDEQNKKNRANQVKTITAYANKQLKAIAGTKNISTHIARHTFAKMAIDSVKDFNISMDLVGHSNIEEHERYIRELSQDDALDDAADKIFS